MLACTIPIFCMPFVYHCWHVHINVACIHVASCMLLVHWAFNLIANSLNLFFVQGSKDTGRTFRTLFWWVLLQLSFSPSFSSKFIYQVDTFTWWWWLTRPAEGKLVLLLPKYLQGASWCCLVVLIKSACMVVVVMNHDYDQKYDQVGGQRCHTEARLEMEASESFASHTCLSSRHPTDYSGLIEITTDETLFRFAKHCHTDWSKLAQVYQILHISLWSYNCTRWTGSW